MPRFIHARAKHILAKNPSMDKSQAFAISTQQSHKLGKSPKGYGTVAGKQEAKAKYTGPPKSYERRANPGSLKTPKLASAFHYFVEEIDKIAATKLKPRKVGGEARTNIDTRTLNEPTDQEYGDELEEVKASAADLSQVAPHLRLAAEAQQYYPKKGVRTSNVVVGAGLGMLAAAGAMKAFSKSKEKKAYGKSQYSGPLGYGSFPQASYIPPFKRPNLQKVGGNAPAGKVKQAYDPSPVGNVHMPGMRKMKTPAIGLQASKGVAQIKETPPGPSIAQISKPKGYGTPAAGAIKY